MKLVVIFTFFVLIFCHSATLTNAEFVCDDNFGGGDCDPISNLQCNYIPPTQMSSCPGSTGTYYNVASCDAFDHQSGNYNYFRRYYFQIRKNTSTNICGSSGSWLYSHTWYQSGSANTNVFPGTCNTGYVGTVPSGCNSGFQPPAGPTPTPTLGPSPTGGVCPPPWGLESPIVCNNVPCAYKNQCGCSCESPPCSAGDCGGGPPPPPTATPTPTPFCRVFCPGQESYIGGMDINGGGVPQITVQPTPVLPTQASGFINFYGYNNFQCSALDDAKGNVIACPTPLGGGGLGNYGLTSQFTYPTPTTVPLRYNMLCGNNTHIYTAVATSGGVSGSGGGVIGGSQGTPTAGPTNRPGLYPPNCSLGGPTPTPNPLLPGDQQVGGAKAGGGGLVSGAASCSCSVAVGCQTSLQSLPSETGVSCDANCDFTVSPETPEFNDEVTFTASGTGLNGASFFSFDDNSNNAPANAGPVPHTFANSGVYKVALSCSDGAQICTRTVNNYCGPLSWFKIKDASFHKNNTLNDPIPTGVAAYDNDDTTQSLVSIGNPGLVTTNGSITTGAGNLSTPNWRTTIYTPNGTYTPLAFADYLIARKTYSTVTDANSNGIIDSNELTTNATNYIVGNYTIDNNSIQSKAPLVLVVRGNITIDIQNNNEFNPPDKAVTIIATGTLRIDDHMDTLNGIFIATSVDLANGVASTTTPLKIVGNLISQNSVDLKKRIRTDGSKPSLFIVQNYKQYLRVLDKLGIRKYAQTELRP